MLLSQASRASSRISGIMPAAASLRTYCSSSDGGNGNKNDEVKEKLNSLLTGFKRNKAAQDANAKTDVMMAKPKTIEKVDRTTANTKGVDPSLAAAATKVSQHLGKDERSKSKRIESDILRQLKSITKETEVERKESGGGEKRDIAQLIGSFKVEHLKKDPAPYTDDQKKFLDRRRSLRERGRGFEGVRATGGGRDEYDREKGLFGAQPIGIFGPDRGTGEKSGGVRLRTWERCAERHLKQLKTPAPKNFLEDMAQMAENGIMWKFPIDNEQGIDREQTEPFHEHVFLEHYIESWCPERGPVRHFMEVVCVGLQKNPYITVEKKFSHIEWFREYFEEENRNEILKLSGAIESVA